MCCEIVITILGYDEIACHLRIYPCGATDKNRRFVSAYVCFDHVIGGFHTHTTINADVQITIEDIKHDLKVLVTNEATPCQVGRTKFG